MTTRVRIRDGCRHIIALEGEEPEISKDGAPILDEEGKPVMKRINVQGGRVAEAGEEIDVTDAELAAYPDKFEVLDNVRPARPR